MTLGNFFTEEENQSETLSKVYELPAEDQRNFVGFFELLLKVDKRVNPHLYQSNEIQKND
jgi:hypothetical protein